MAYAKVHLKTWPDYDWKEPALRETFGSQPAAQITPHEIDRFLTESCKTLATANRFAPLSRSATCWAGKWNGYVEPRSAGSDAPGNKTRLRYLSRDEYKNVSAIIQRDYPIQQPAFIVSVYTGKRWGEQSSLTWSQVDVKRRVIPVMLSGGMGVPKRNEMNMLQRYW